MKPLDWYVGSPTPCRGGFQRLPMQNILFKLPPLTAPFGVVPDGKKEWKSIITVDLSPDTIPFFQQMDQLLLGPFRTRSNPTLAQP